MRINVGKKLLQERAGLAFAMATLKKKSEIRIVKLIK